MPLTTCACRPRGPGEFGGYVISEIMAVFAQRLNLLEECREESVLARFVPMGELDLGAGNVRRRAPPAPVKWSLESGRSSGCGLYAIFRLGRLPRDRGRRFLLASATLRLSNRFWGVSVRWSCVPLTRPGRAATPPANFGAKAGRRHIDVRRGVTCSWRLLKETDTAYSP